MDKKAILITGASGFIGTWLAHEAFKAGYLLIGIDIHAPQRPDIWTSFATSACETVDLDHLTINHNLYAVCHLAGSASVVSSVENPYGDFSSLLPGTAKLLLFLAQKHAQARIFIFSSAAVYGNPSEMPITENTKVSPISPYGIHKLLAENLASHYARIYKLHVIVFRIFSVYGPGLRKQLIWDVASKAMKAVEEGRAAITLFGTGRESRDFIYIEDLCKIVLYFLTLPGKNSGVETFNLGTGCDSTVENIATDVVKYLDILVDVYFDGTVRTGDPANWKTDVSKLAAVGFQHTYSLQQGLQQVTDWIKLIYNLEL